jgi:hypothetical protein
MANHGMELARNLESGGLATMLGPIARLPGGAQLAAASGFVVSHGDAQKNAVTR